MEQGILFHSLQDMGSEPGRANPDCLSVPLILGEILKYFTSTELLQLSFVNKQWNYEARSLMRNRGNLSASINKNHTCQDVRAFASDLRQMREITKVVPFSGMIITVGGPKCANKDHCQQSPNRELEPVYEEILGSLTWKHLSVRHLVGWEKHKSCPGFVLLKKLLRKLHSVLEELSIQHEWAEASSFTEEFLKDCNFSHLKTFKLLNEHESTDLIKTVVSTAPNLQVLYTKARVHLDDTLLKGNAAVHLAAASYSPAGDNFSEIVASRLRMQRMHLLLFSSSFSLERFNRIASMLLQSSRTVMNSMEINIIFLASLMNYGICLENVREVELSLDFLLVEQRQPPFWRIAKSFDFTRIFPNLNTVTIRDFSQYRFEHVPAEFNEMIDQVNAALQPPPPDRAVLIKHLKLHLPPRLLRRHSSLQLLAQMFPHAQKLSIATMGNPFVDVRDIWVDLKEVEFTVNGMVSDHETLHSVACGILSEELVQLREVDYGTHVSYFI